MEIYALDTAAVMLGGTVAASSLPMTRTVLSACGKPEATVMAVGRVTSAWDAALRALGIAGTQASGLTEWRADGSWIKRLHPGCAAQSGVLASRLAREGFTGPATIFEGDGGFFRAFSYGEPIDTDAMTRGLG